MVENGGKSMNLTNSADTKSNSQIGHTQTILNEDQLQFWKNQSHLLLQDLLSPNEIKKLVSWTEELQSWPETPGKWMKYFETPPQNKSKRLLCRVENFLQYHEGFNNLLKDPRILGALSQLMGETALLFKEKINFKMPDGNGFKAHQDAPAFVSFNQKYHITMMIAVDQVTVENGCLEVVPHFANSTETLEQANDGTLSQRVIDSFQWQPVLMNPGDILFFDSYLPHRSAPNKSASARRALYITYNRQSEGSYRNEYFQQKRAHFPPECERTGDTQPVSGKNIFNLGNPID